MRGQEAADRLYRLSQVAGYFLYTVGILLALYAALHGASVRSETEEAMTDNRVAIRDEAVKASMNRLGSIASESSIAFARSARYATLIDVATERALAPDALQGGEDIGSC